MSTLVRKVLIGIGGGLTVIVGIVLIPTPAPEGWLIVFAGITLLGTEFSFAKKLLAKAKGVRLKIQTWVKSLPRWLRVSLNVLIVLGVLVVVVAGVWVTLRVFA